MPLIPTFVATIFTGLRAAIGAAAAKNRADEPLLVQTWRYLGRTAARFHRLFTLWQAGTLPAPRPRTARPPKTPHPESAHPESQQPESPQPDSTAPTPTPRLPRRLAWLLRYNNDMGNFGYQLRHLQAQPEMARFLAEVPRAGRLLRPLLHMLGTDLFGTALYKSPPKRRPRPPRPPKPKLPPLRPMPAYVWTAVRAWKPKYG